MDTIISSVERRVTCHNPACREQICKTRRDDIVLDTISSASSWEMTRAKHVYDLPRGLATLTTAQRVSHY